MGNSIFVQISPQFVGKVSEKRLVLAAQAAIDLGGWVGDGDISLVINDQNFIRELNKTFLGIDQSTDVLSFPGEEIDPDTGRLYLGDVIISYTDALQQSVNGNHSLMAELELLVVHGVLHLIGYDHNDSEEQARMWGIQDLALKTIRHTGS